VATAPRIINLLRVPGAQQVLLKVKVAELDRTAMRQIGADWFLLDRENNTFVGTQIGGSSVAATGGTTLTATASISNQTTVFGIFDPSHFAFFLSALRKNGLTRILAEPNLIAMNGQVASFLAGGEFPVPIPQTTTGGVGTSVSVTFKEFGVRLAFVPTILDGDNIRLSVDPEVSNLDFAFATTLVPGGTPVPGLDSRKAHTTVELKQGQTLAIAGLLQLTLDGTTSRIPGLGDLPIIGPFFSNTTGDRQEKELIVLVTPYLVEPLNPDQVPPGPGDEVRTPTDLEFYLLNRIEGKTAVDWRATTEYDDALGVLRCFLKLEKEHIRGPYGYCN
jgi:pilus assembly protein CpaC